VFYPGRLDDDRRVDRRPPGVRVLLMVPSAKRRDRSRAF
jgi:hypothetical protein